jgi:hypothetical protein
MLFGLHVAQAIGQARRPSVVWLHGLGRAASRTEQGSN